MAETDSVEYVSALFYHTANGRLDFDTNFGFFCSFLTLLNNYKKNQTGFFK
jgi:hypothetical protein